MIYRRLFVASRLQLSARFSSNLSYTHAASNIPFRTTTIDDELRKSVERAPDQELFIFKHQQIRRTYAQLYEDVS